MMFFKRIRGKKYMLNDRMKIEIEEQVNKFCSDCDIATDGAVDIVSIARKKGFLVQRLNMGNDITGIILYDEDNYITGTDTHKLVVVKKGLSEEKSRFILAHELGHYSDLKGKKSQISHREYSKLGISIEEQKADYFARAILMPKERIINIITMLQKEELDENSIIKRIADEFRVSEAKARFRFYDVINLFMKDDGNASMQEA